MAVPTVFSLHGINLAGTSFLSQIDEASPTPGIQQMLGAPAGFPQPMFRGVKGLKPVIPFRTSQLATLFAANAFFVDLSAGNTDLIYRSMTNLGTRGALSSSLHTRIRLNKGWWVCKEIQARLQQEATAQVELFAVYDGTNAPMVAAGTVSATGTPIAAEHFALGPVSVNGVQLAGAQEVTIDPGFQLIQLSGNYPYDAFIGIKSSDPKITIKGVDITPWSSYGVSAAISSATIYLRKMNADGANGLPYIADATAAHILFSATNGLITVNSSGGGQSEATSEITLYLRPSDSAHDALSVAVAQSIS